MTIFQNSTGAWVYHDGSNYHYFETQQEAEAMATYSTIGETPAEVEIAATVTGNLLPQLREALLALQSLKMAWYANGIPEMIESAASAEGETLIAGFSASTWSDWGAVFTSLEEWLNTPLPDTKRTPLAILARRYTRRGEK